MRQEGSTEASQHRPSHYSNGSSPSNSTSPLKGVSSTFTNGSSATADGYTNGQASSRPSGAFFGHNREEVTRILIQSLTDLGYHSAASSLSRESGYELEVPSVAAFRSAIQEGDWDTAEALLFGNGQEEDGGVGLRDDSSTNGRGSKESRRRGLPLADGVSRHDMLFLMRQQKYLELLEERDLGNALMVLRQELTPLHQDVSRLHLLSSLMMCQSADDIKAQAHWDGVLGQSRNQLLSELSKSISPSVMIPEHRLAVLLDEVQDAQISNCLYHNTTEPPSLYHDHMCDPEDFPLDLYTELREHTDEVWYLEFSHDGSMLASASKDNSVIIYDTNTWRAINRLTDRGQKEPGVCYVSWSPDDKYLLSCSQGRDLVIYEAKTGSRIGSIDHFTYPVTTAAWSPDGQSFVIGSQDSKRPLGLYQFSDREQIHAWVSEESNSMRINDCSISADGSRLAAITSDNRVLVHDFKTRVKIADWMMEDKLSCVSLSADGTSLLVSMNEGRLMLLDAETGEIVHRYSGLKQSEFVIRSAFGGAGENFVISGSEDSHVYIWRKQTGQQVAALEAHSPGTVNSVAWHPTNPAIFASAGDDHKVRIWSNSQALRRASQLGLGRSIGNGGYLR